MNVLKAFQDYSDAYEAQEKFTLDNYCGILTVDNWGKMSFMNGHTVYFKIIQNMEDCHKLAGICFSWVEYSGFFEPEIKQWIASRVRG